MKHLQITELCCHGNCFIMQRAGNHHGDEILTGYHLDAQIEYSMRNFSICSMELNAISNLVHIPLNLDRIINSLQALCIASSPAFSGRVYDLKTCWDSILRIAVLCMG